MNSSDPENPPAKARHWTRRRFLKWTLGTTATLAVGSGLYSWRIEPHWIDVVRRDLPIANLPGALAGRTLALIGDLHVGPVVDDDYIRGALQRVNALGPDLVAMVGDFMTAARSEQVAKAIDVVSVLARPPMGAFAVLGNHDYGHQWQFPAVAARLAEGLTGLGVTVLRNAVVTVDGLQIAGLDDIWGYDPAATSQVHVPGGGDFDMPHRDEKFSTGSGGFFAPLQALSKVDPGRAAITLVHNPDAADLPVWGDYRGWILAGHTHGGQVDLPFFGPPMLPTSNKNYIEGEYALPDGRRMYINRGLGYLRRVRLFARPEITLFTLKSGATS